MITVKGLIKECCSYQAKNRPKFDKILDAINKNGHHYDLSLIDMKDEYYFFRPKETEAQENRETDLSNEQSKLQFENDNFFNFEFS